MAPSKKRSASVKQLAPLSREWNSWRDEFKDRDVQDALKFAGLAAWVHDTWTDGDIQFTNRTDKVSFEELAKLHTTFMPKRMVVESLTVDCGMETAIYVTLSWNEVSDPEAT